MAQIHIAAPESALLRNRCVTDSLSIIVPVRNAEETLSGQLHELLELAADLTGSFEILVVDDGSNDQTAEVARELARRYPQLRCIRHQSTRGRDMAVKTGLAQATGRTVLVCEDTAFSPTDLRRLWSLRQDRELVMARTQKQPGVLDPDLLERLTTWGQSLRNLAKRASSGGIQMIRRDAAQELAPLHASSRVVVVQHPES
jgi:cellulose synthase/poly-beta-1,6-N-acetylglucosamine synthase-like glycosyltransferase